MPVIRPSTVAHRVVALLAAVLMALSLVVAASTVVDADVTFTVTTSVDVPDDAPGDGECRSAGFGCSLRGAIEEANALAGNDTVLFDRARRIRLTAGPLVVDPVTAADELRIRGVGMGATIIDADTPLFTEPLGAFDVLDNEFGSVHRVLDVVGGSRLELDDLTITDGGIFPATGTEFGGGVRVLAGDLDVERVEFRGNAVGTLNGIGSFGGAIGHSSPGTLNVVDSEFVGNAADEAGGAIWASGGDVAIENSLFELNGELPLGRDGAQELWLPRFGGAVHTSVPTSILGSRFRANSALTGGALHQNGGGQLTVLDSEFEDNDALTAGGAISTNQLLDVRDTAFVGNEARTLDGGGSTVDGYGGAVSSSGETLFGDTVIDANHAGIGGGGITWSGTGSVLMADTSVVNNTAGRGAGFFGDSTPAAGLQLQVIRSSVIGNAASDFGGGIRLGINGSSAGFVDSTIAHNTAPSGQQFSVTGAGPGSLQVTGSIVDWDSGSSHCVNTTFNGGNHIKDGADCDDADGNRVNDVINAGDILNRELGLVAREVGGGHLGLPITPGHPAASAEPGCGPSFDARGVLKQDPCAAGALEDGFLVDTAADTPDDNPGDGVCADNLGQCSLRAAWEESSGLTGVVVELGTTPAIGSYPLGALPLSGSAPVTILLANPAAAGGTDQPEIRQPTTNSPILQVGAFRTELVGIDLVGEDRAVSGEGGLVQIFDEADFVMRGGGLFNGLAVNGGAVAGDNTSILLDGIVAENNRALGIGGMAHIGGESQLVVRDSTIGGSGAGNHATEGGGAVNVEGFSELTAINSVFQENSAGTDVPSPSGDDLAEGGVVRIEELGAVELLGTQFLDNTVGGGNGGATEGRGGVVWGNEDTDTTIGPYWRGAGTSAFARNDAVSFGGAVFVNDGDAPGTDPSSTSRLQVRVTDMETNSASEGGAVYTTGDTEVTVADALFDDNTTSAPEGGGAIRSGASTLDVVDSTFSANEAIGGRGGAIATTAPRLTLLESDFTDNLADLHGGGVSIAGADVRLDRSTFSGNAAPDGGAFSMFGNGTVASENNLYNGNEATSGNGGAMAADGFGADQLRFLDDRFLGNAAAGDGGGLYVTEVGLLDARRSRFDGNTATNGAGIAVDTVVEAALSTFLVDNVATNEGGGLHVRGPGNTVLAFNFIADSNDANVGGGVFVQDAQVITSGIYVRDNVAAFSSGGIAVADSPQFDLVDSVVSGNTAQTGDGGGVSVVTTAGGSLVNLDRASIVDNVATAGAGGGLILAQVGGSMNAFSINSTIANNQAADEGGGVLVIGATTSLDHTTIAFNESGTTGGGVFDSGATTTIRASVIANNTAPTGPDCNTNIESQDSLIGNNDDCLVLDTGGTIVDVDPELDPVLVTNVDIGNGTAIRNFAAEPALTSPVINQVPCSFLIDVLGQPRPGTSVVSCDLGSFEVQEELAAPALAVTLDVDKAVVGPGATIVPTANLDPTGLVAAGTTDGTVDGTPINNVPINNVPINNVPINNVPINNVPINNVSFDDPLVRPGLDAVPVSELSFREPQPLVDGSVVTTWAELVDRSDDLRDRPVQSVSLADLLEDADVGALVQALPMNNINFGATRISDIPLWTVLTAGNDLDPSDPGHAGGLRLDDIPWAALFAGGDVDADPQVHLDALCDELLARGFACADLGLAGPVYDGSRTVLEAAIVGAPINNVPINNVPINNVPINNVPINNVQVRDVPINNVPINNVPINNVPINNVPLDLVTIDLDPTEGEDLTTLDQADLATAEIRGVPINNVPINNVPINNVDIDDAPINNVPINNVLVQNSPINNVPINNVPINNVDPATSPINNVPINNVPINNVPINNVPINNVDVVNSPINNVPINNVAPEDLAPLMDCNVGYDCSAPDATFGGALAAGVVYEDAVLGLLVPLFAAPGAPYIGLLDVLNAIDPTRPEIAETTFGDLGPLTDANGEPAFTFGDLRPLLPDSVTIGGIAEAFRDLGYSNEVAALLTSTVLGELTELGGLFFADLVPLLGESLLREVLQLLVFFPGSDAVSLGDILLLLIPPDQYPWTEANIGGGIQAAAGGEIITYTATIDLSGNAGEELELTFTLPDGGSLAQGQSATVEQNGASLSVPSRTSGQVLTYNLSPLQDGQATFIVPVAAPIEVGDRQAAITVMSVNTGLEASDTAGVLVAEEFEPNDTIADLDAGGGTELVNDTLVLSHIGTPGDVDLFPVTLEKGEAFSAFLGNVPDGIDLDLVLYGPANSAVPGVGVDSVDTGDGVAQYGDDILLLDELPAVRISADRSRATERVDLPPVQFAGRYVLQVNEYRGLAATSPYTIQSRVFPAAQLPPCQAWPAGLTTTPATAPSVVLPGLDATTRTLFLVNRARYVGAHGPDALDALDAALAQVSGLVDGDGVPYVDGAVIALDEIPDVATAYAAWDGPNRCDVPTANAVSDAIRDVVNDARLQAPIGHVVVVGSDEQVPFQRVPDFVELSNERTYASSVARRDASGAPVADELQAAVAFGYYLSDNLYADSTTEVASNRPIWTPEIGLGRLVEDDDEILGQLQQFITFEGRLDPATSRYVAGYDFLTDGAQRVADNLGSPVDTLINDTWESQAIRDRIAQQSDDVVSVNAHYDHTQLLSAAEDTNGTQADLFNATEFAGAYDGSIVFTMGCHSALSVSDVSVGFGVQDWAQQVSGTEKGLYVGNTGFGYGDTEVVALSELLMANFADRLDGTMTVGQALAFAKSEYAADLSTYGVYDEKVLMIATYYGMPNFRIGDPGQQPPVDARVDLAVDHGLPARTDVDFGTPDQTLQPVAVGDETYWVVEQDGVRLDPQATHERPLQPRWEVDVTAHDGVGGVQSIARGAVIESMSTTDVPGVDPVIAQPVVDSSTEARELFLEDLAFPSTFTRVSRAATPIGPRDQLVVVPGRFAGTSTKGVQTLFEAMDLTVYYDDDEDESTLTRPRIASTDAVVNGDVAGFRVVASDSAGLQRVVLLVSEPGSNDWFGVDLARSGTDAQGREVWTGGTTLSRSLDIGEKLDVIVQAVSTRGVPGVSTAKAVFHPAPALAPIAPPAGGGEEGAPATPAAAGTKVGGWYTGTVQVSIDGDVDGDATLFVNGEEVIGGSTTLDQSGTYRVAVVDEGEETVSYVLIDNDGPQVTIDQPVDGALLARNATVPLSFTAEDAGAGRDEATVDDEPDTVDTSTLGDASHTVTVADVLGNATSATTSWTVVELTADPSPIATGSVFELTANGLASIDGVTVDWGDGAGFVPVADATVGSSSTTLRHVYTTSGVYTIRVRRAGPTVVEYQSAVIYDVNGRHVSGGGWFISPLGAVYSNTSLTGKAHFQFTSKYKKGKSIPTGNTKFRFKDADLDFRSTSYDWLLIDGDRLQYMGTGTVNGNDGYRFTVVAIDGDVSTGLFDRDDRFRIRIWMVNADGSDGPVVYDNGLGLSTNGDAGTDIGGGQIKIHSG